MMTNAKASDRAYVGFEDDGQAGEFSLVHRRRAEEAPSRRMPFLFAKTIDLEAFIILADEFVERGAWRVPVIKPAMVRNMGWSLATR